MIRLRPMLSFPFTAVTRTSRCTVAVTFIRDVEFIFLILITLTLFGDQKPFCTGSTTLSERLSAFAVFVREMKCLFMVSLKDIKVCDIKNFYELVKILHLLIVLFSDIDVISIVLYERQSHKLPLETKTFTTEIFHKMKWQHTPLTYRQQISGQMFIFQTCAAIDVTTSSFSIVLDSCSLTFVSYN